MPAYLTVYNSQGNIPTYASVTLSSSAPSVAVPVDSTFLVAHDEARIAAVGERRAVITVRVGSHRDTLPVTLVPR